MITIKSEVGYVDTEHFVIEVGSEPICLDFGQQVDDILISTPDGPVLTKWDIPEWNDNKCFLVNGETKEIGSLHCTKFLLKSPSNKILKVYVTGQRN